MKGQLDFPVLTFVVVVIGLIIIAPVLLKVVNIIIPQFSSAVGNQTEIAGTNVAYIGNSFNGWVDTLIMVAFIVNVILLLITSFLVDTHPVWVVLYMLFLVFMFIFAPMFLDTAKALYYPAVPTGADFSTEVSKIPMTEFVLNNFGLIILSIAILSGVIMYAKYKIQGGGM